MCVNSYEEVQYLALSRLLEFERTQLTPVANQINIVQFARHYGFEVYEDILDCSGQIMISKDLEPVYKSNKVILLNKFDPVARQRFTLAHEMGHYFMNLQSREASGEAYIAHRDSDVMYKTRDEKFADYFASVLLMPAHKVLDVIQRLPRKHDVVNEVKNVFGVSEAAARVRLMQLGVLSNG